MIRNPHQIYLPLLIVVEDLDELHDILVGESLEQPDLSLNVLLTVRDFPEQNIDCSSLHTVPVPDPLVASTGPDPDLPFSHKGVDWTERMVAK
jgi:hypothetical protein